MEKDREKAVRCGKITNIETDDGVDYSHIYKCKYSRHKIGRDWGGLCPLHEALTQAREEAENKYQTEYKIAQNAVDDLGKANGTIAKLKSIICDSSHAVLALKEEVGLLKAANTRLYYEELELREQIKPLEKKITELQRPDFKENMTDVSELSRGLVEKKKEVGLLKAANMRLYYEELELREHIKTLEKKLAMMRDAMNTDEEERYQVIKGLGKKIADTELCVKTQRSRAENALINGRRLLVEAEKEHEATKLCLGIAHDERNELEKKIADLKKVTWAVVCADELLMESAADMENDDLSEVTEKCLLEYRSRLSQKIHALKKEANL